ncbi:hypothetical protein FOWG_16775 [Fusarium oxysporum f. sp. lycopersici MN25]|nr:hypothetical protein FOWG_16775 [Fusarium oxysporum f. sp. lycopersici MN25]
MPKRIEEALKKQAVGRLNNGMFFDDHHLTHGPCADDLVRQALRIVRPENALSGSADSDGMERISIPIRLSCRYCARCSRRDYHSRGVQSISRGKVFIKESRLSEWVKNGLLLHLN